MATAVALALVTAAASAEQGASTAQQSLPELAVGSALALASINVVGVAPLPGLGIDRDLLPYAVQTASSRDVRQAAGENLSEFMARTLTGVGINEISGSPFQNDVTFRGFRASPVLGSSQGISVYLDGVRVNEPFGDVVNWDMVPEAAIGSVLLAPGSNPLYGLNSLGGALALNSKSGKTYPGLDVSVSDASSGQRRTDLAYGYSGEQSWHAFVAATLFNDQGWREHSNGRLGNLYLKLGGTSGASEWNLALLGGSSSLVGNGLLPSYRSDENGQGLYETNRRSIYTYADETRNRLHQAVFTLIHDLGEAGELSANAYARNSRRDTVNGDISEAYGDYVADCGAGFLADGSAAQPDTCGYDRASAARLHPASFNTTRTRQNSQGASVNLRRDVAAHKLLAGLTFDRSSVSFAQYEQLAYFTPDRGVLADSAAGREATSSVSGSTHTVGLYGSDTWSVTPDTHVTASARYNRARVANTLVNAGTAQAPEAFTYQKLNPAIGVAHDAGSGVSLLANWSQSTRVPTVIELGCADPELPCRLPVGLQSDPYLKQVVSRTIEAGARWQAGHGASATLSVYRTVNQDDILFRSAGTTQQGYFSNFKRTRHQGADLSATGQLGDVTARLSYSYLQAVYDADGTLFTGARNVQVAAGTRIAGLPRHTFKLGLDWRATPALTVGAELVARSDLLTQGNEDGLIADAQEGQAPQSADLRIRGYATLGLHMNYHPTQRWELYARVNNVTNRRYETFGAVAPDMFPNGRLLQPLDGAVQAAPVHFVAPGAPRSVVAGLRYHF
ncbi:TonB-dependent receptor [Duganella sp. LX47W]|uniref:TonB-dependent receptor n=1 Tax=Rugamonas apoptosis TaxID=2758570 RepID=A0A7W2FFG6_9BURK|nr:TonB-dependent receptor [Rugamonas apoptosis]